jgi:poly-gamma-glutamate capsule biosynthesis protein CapA/YwtB (metallophosphatase superfamily)
VPVTTSRRRFRRQRVAIPAVAVLLASLVGCAPAASGPVVSWHEGVPAAASPTPAPVPEVTLAFAGDVHFTGRTLPLLDEPGTAFGPFADVFADADFTMVNLETAVTERGTPEPKTFLFRAPPAAYDALHAAGVDVVSLANNHTLDYGQVGLLDTLDHAEAAGMPYVGAGRDAGGAYAPYVTTVGATRLAVLGFSQVWELADRWAATDSRPGIAMAHDTDRAAAAVAAAAANADVVVVYMHWGQEGNPCPTGEMRAFAELMADSGADIVLGTHAHVLMGDGWIGSTYVHWGLGNFLWYSTSRSTDSGVLRLTLRDHEVRRVEFLPGVVSDTGQPVPVTGAVREALLARLARAAECAGLDGPPPDRAAPPLRTGGATS